jgi:hypothetical protein
MAVLAQELSARPGRGAWGVAAAGLILVLLAAAGCTTLDTFVGCGDAPPTGAIFQVQAIWNPEVLFTPDPTHGGTPTPGIAGRLYLFGKVIGAPLEGDGSVLVALYNEDGDKPKLMEEWQIDAATLHRLLRKDMIGWGYTLFLPWGTYRPDIKRVHLKLSYQPAKGAALYSDSQPMCLRRDDAGPVKTVTSAKVPAAAAAPQITRFPMPREAPGTH